MIERDFMLEDCYNVVRNLPMVQQSHKRTVNSHFYHIHKALDILFDLEILDDDEHGEIHKELDKFKRSVFESLRVSY